MGYDILSKSNDYENLLKLEIVKVQDPKTRDQLNTLAKRRTVQVGIALQKTEFSFPLGSTVPMIQQINTKLIISMDQLSQELAGIDKKIDELLKQDKDKRDNEHAESIRRLEAIAQEEAKKHKELLDKYDAQERQIETINAQAEDGIRQIQNAADRRVEDAEARAKRAEDEMRRLRAMMEESEVREKQREIDQLKSALSRITQENNELKNKIEAMEFTVQHAEDAEKRVADREARVETRIESVRQDWHMEVAGAKKELADVRSEFERYKAEATERAVAHRQQNTQNLIDTAASSAAQVQQAVIEIANRATQGFVKGLKNKIKALEEELTAAYTRTAELEQLLQSADANDDAELEAQRARNQELEREIEELRSKYAAWDVQTDAELSD